MNRFDLPPKFVEGWLRVFLGTIQIVCATTTLILLFTVGITPMTWGVVLGAFTATVISRILYGGREAGR